MNKIIIGLSGVVLGLVVLASEVQTQEAVPSKLIPFGKQSDQILFQKNHLYLFNGTTSVGLVPDHFGIHRLVAPPYFAYPFRADLQLFGQDVSVDQYNWYPSECLFLGQAFKGIAPRLQVVPLKSQRGALVTLTLRNTTSWPVTVPVKWGINGGPGKSLHWTFSDKHSFAGGRRKRLGPVTTTLENNALTKLRGDARLVASLSGMAAKVEDHSLSGKITVAPGKAVKLSLIVVVGDKEKVSVAETKTLGADPDRLVQETRNYWTRMFEMSDRRLPTLTGASPELQTFYRAGVISFLSTRFEVPEFLFNPYYATCGIDGGAANCYLWDFSYTSTFPALLDPAAMRKQILHWFKLDIGKCYAFDPVYGKQMGPRYSYNYYNLARLVYNYISVTGDLSIMKEPVDGKSALTLFYKACFGFEDLNKPPTLLDYGSNHNLLELRRTKNYTHVTPSPNGERVLTYRFLTEIYKALGKKTPHDLVKRAEGLKKLFLEKMWNEEKQWLNTLDEKGKPRIAYSIQIFDVLRTQMLSEKQERGILTHLKEGEFLSKWGVYSLAKTDPGYDPTDVDWGGPGAYTGDPGELIVDLCQAGYGEHAVNVLKRILWWGEMPYLPQAMRANKKGYREDGRSNLNSGAITSLAVINGLFGIEPTLNQIKIQPINHPMMKGLKLTGVKMRGRTFDVKVDEKSFSVRENGKVITNPLGKSVILMLSTIRRENEY